MNAQQIAEALVRYDATHSPRACSPIEALIENHGQAYFKATGRFPWVVYLPQACAAHLERLVMARGPQDAGGLLTYRFLGPGLRLARILFYDEVP